MTVTNLPASAAVVPTNQSLSGTTFGNTAISDIATRTISQLADQHFNQPYTVITNVAAN